MLCLLVVILSMFLLLIKLDIIIMSLVLSLLNYNIDMEMSTLIGIIYENIPLILSQYFLLLYKTYKSDKN